MTLKELAALPGYSVGTKIAAQFLGTSQWGLTLAAKAGDLGLPYVFSGNRLKNSKAALLEFKGHQYMGMRTLWQGAGAIE